MNNNRAIRYNRDFLNEKTFINKNNKYVPKYHIYPTKGLINDPNCIFYFNNEFYIFFQHHPNNTLHGLKTMSLAKSKDLINFEYYFMINKPEYDFESHGVYSGNAIIKNNKPILFYTGNKRDNNWNRTSSIIKAEYDIKNNKIINKTKIIDNHQFENYTDHFRDPFIFEYNSNYYFLLGAQNKKEIGCILLFKLDSNLENPILIKEIKLDNSIKMMECPNIFFKKNNAYIIYCPQYNLSKYIDNPDKCYYSSCAIIDLFNNKKTLTLDNFKILDYGLEYYAPQLFSKDNENYIISWIGVPTINEYYESKNGWVHTLSMVNKINVNNNKIILKELESYKNYFQNNENELIEYFEISLTNKESFNIFDGNKEIFKITFENELLTFWRHEIDFFKYKNLKKIKINSNNVNLKIYIDVSIIEIKINNELSYSSRIYINDRIVGKIKNEK